MVYEKDFIMFTTRVSWKEKPIGLISRNMLKKFPGLNTGKWEEIFNFGEYDK